MSSDLCCSDMDGEHFYHHVYLFLFLTPSQFYRSYIQVLDVVEMHDEQCTMTDSVFVEQTRTKILFTWACLMINPFENMDSIDFTKFETLMMVFSATAKRLKLVLTQAQTEQGAE